MTKNKVLFLSTNPIWGGSEVLWTQAAHKLNQLNYHVRAATEYEFRLVARFIQNENLFLNISKRFDPLPIWKRALNKLGFANFRPADKLEKFVKHDLPDLAIISQGNNIEGIPLMEFCVANKIPFVTIIQLVLECKWPMFDEQKIDKLHFLFNQSLANFFVSRYTLQLHEKFIGYRSEKSRIIYNPFIRKTNEECAYPPLVNGRYKIALLGRLENYHKGYDLLIDVLSLAKWKERNIQFTIYGHGPHLSLTNRLIALNGINNLFINEYVEDIADVWKANHLLMMPSRVEGQSLTLIEAMNFKRASVVTQVGGIEELIEEGVSGFIAEHPTAHAIDNALERAWTRRGEWEGMGISAYNSIKHNHPGDATGYFIGQIQPFLES